VIRPGSTRANAHAEYADLLARAEADPNVVGLIVFGSRGFDEYVTEDSDFDVLVIVESQPEPWRTPHGTGVEVWPMTLEEFRGHALSGSTDAWNRPTFLGVRVILDKRKGEIDHIVRQKQRLAPDEARANVPVAADDYINSLYRSLRNLEGGRLLEGRLDGLESLAPLLTTAFALEGRVRPFNKWLRFEVAREPLSIDGLIEAVEAVSRGPTTVNQRAAFRLLESALRAAGFDAAVDSWAPDVAWLRGSATDAPATGGIGLDEDEG
jgi:hypothetical protein